MITHVVLFRPRAGLADAGRAAFVRAIARARREIPSIRRFHVGRRVRLGHAYERAMTQDFPYAAIIEFDAVDDLTAYLTHPAHAELGRLLGETSEAWLACDYDTRDAAEAQAIL